MSARSLNKVTLIGNLTRDPELRFTPAGTAVCTFGLATNRSWTTQTGETKEETEFHRIVAWNKLGELCSQLLAKGRKVYVEGRLATHSWIGQDGGQRSSTEIVIEDMIILDSKRVIKEESSESKPAEVRQLADDSDLTDKSTSTKKSPPKLSVKEDLSEKKKDEEVVTSSEVKNEDITPDDIPF